jgi:hypothetical protein
MLISNKLNISFFRRIPKVCEVWVGKRRQDRQIACAIFDDEVCNVLHYKNAACAEFNSAQGRPVS